MAKLTTLEGLNMTDPYVKYGTIAGAALLAYMVYQKQGGLSDVSGISGTNKKYPASWGKSTSNAFFNADDINYKLIIGREKYGEYEWEVENEKIYMRGEWSEQDGISVAKYFIYKSDKKKDDNIMAIRQLKNILTASIEQYLSKNATDHEEYYDDDDYDDEI